MAIGTPVERYAVRAVFNGSSQDINPASTIAAGTTAILVAHGAGVSGNGDNYLTAVADSVGGNTWAVDHVYAPGASDANSISFASAKIVTPITSTDTITLTWSASGNVNRSIWIQEVSGLATSAFDKSADDTQFSGGGVVSTPSTGTLSQADEIVFCSSGNNTNTSDWTKGATYTDVGTPQLARISALEYKIVAATTGVVGEGTWTPAVRWNASVVTYKGAAAVAYTILNGSDEQLVNVNAGGTDVDAASYKDGVELTESELATLLDGTSFGKKNVAVLPNLTGVADARQIKKTTFSAETESA